MKSIIVATALLLVFSIPAFSKDHYVFIEKIGIVHQDKEVGNTEIGDVVAVFPVTPQFNPTKSELQNFHVVIVDLTQTEVNDLTVPKKDFSGREVKSRVLTVDYETFSDKKQKARISNAEFRIKTTSKP